VPYIQVTGELAPGYGPVVVRWQDGEWSGEPHALEMIRQVVLLDCPDGMIGQSPTGPFWAVTSPEGASRLAVGPFTRIDDIDTNIETPALEYVDGRVYGPRILFGWEADSGLEGHLRNRLAKIKVKGPL